MRIFVTRTGSRISSAIPGPANPLDPQEKPMTAPFTVSIDHSASAAVLEIQRKKVKLKLKEYSPWVHLSFRSGVRTRIAGICRFFLSDITPDFRLYVTPINLDPERPALPLSHPFVYASYLARVLGTYATLGLAEDTWALNEKVIDEHAFLQFVYSLQEEREKMLFDALEKVGFGTVICVFDITDRVQHMFWRYTPKVSIAGSEHDANQNDRTIEEVYERMDEMVGKVLSRLKKNDVLMVLSDHGFTSFQRCVNLNAWLRGNGFLVLKEGEKACDGYLRNVDWSQTKAYALGLGGIYINQLGRESRGIVRNGQQKEAVKRAIASGLKGLVDPETGAIAVARVFDADQVYAGPYVENGPDLVVGFAEGYRTSWDSVVGGFDCTIFEENNKPWSGDHCVDPRIVPGVLFCSRPVTREEPGIVDMAPTVLDLFGLPVPSYMDGTPFLSASWNETERARAADPARNR
jgi:hypothetical protein